MKTTLRKTIKPTITVEEQTKITDVIDLLKAISEAADNDDKAILLDRDDSDIYDIHIIKNVIEALGALDSLEIE